MKQQKKGVKQKRSGRPRLPEGQKRKMFGISTTPEFWRRFTAWSREEGLSRGKALEGLFALHAKRNRKGVISHA